MGYRLLILVILVSRAAWALDLGDCNQIYDPVDNDPGTGTNVPTNYVPYLKCVRDVAKQQQNPISIPPIVIGNGQAPQQASQSISYAPGNSAANPAAPDNAVASSTIASNAAADHAAANAVANQINALQALDAGQLDNLGMSRAETKALINADPREVFTGADPSALNATREKMGLPPLSFSQLGPGTYRISSGQH